MRLCSVYPQTQGSLKDPIKNMALANLRRQILEGPVTPLFKGLSRRKQKQKKKKKKKTKKRGPGGILHFLRWAAH